jgi:hypothetical protein
MNEEVPDAHERILEIFESVREVPGAPFDAEHLVQYLIDNPDRRIELHDTFKGKRRFFRFMRTIEEEYTICFSLKDDELKSLGQWVDRVTYLRSTPKSSLTTIANRMKEPPPYIPALVVAVVFLIGVAFGWRLFSAYSLFLLVVPITVIIFLYRSHWQELRFYSDMKEKIMSRSGATQKQIG